MKDVIVSADSFEQLVLPQKSDYVTDAGTYLVYTSPLQFVRVEAVSAQEALEKSGVKDALRVVRSSAVRVNVVQPEDIAAMTAKAPEAAPAAPAEEAAAAPAEEAPTPDA